MLLHSRLAAPLLSPAPHSRERNACPCTLPFRARQRSSRQAKRPISHCALWWSTSDRRNVWGLAAAGRTFFVCSVFHNYAFEGPFMYVAIFLFFATMGPGKFAVSTALGWDKDKSLGGLLKQ